MNYPALYAQTNRRHLATKSFELLRTLGIEGVKPYKEFTLAINQFEDAYKHYLLLFDKGMARVNKSLKPIVTNAHPAVLMLIVQRIGYMRDFCVENELYEVLGRIWEINKKLAKSISRLRPDIDITSLLSEDEFKEYEKEMYKEIRAFIRSLY